MKQVLAGFLYVVGVTSAGVGAGRVAMGAIDGLVLIAVAFLCVIMAGRWV